MKNIISISILILYSGLLMSQNQNINKDTKPKMATFTLPESEIVKSCDSNSRVTYICAKMEVSEKKLPKAFNDKEAQHYKLNSKVKNVTFSFESGINNEIHVWLKGMKKHCFVLDSAYKFSFISYDLTKEMLEVYGQIKWNKFFRNFRVIFYVKSNDVLFDLDDDVLRISQERR